MNIQRTLSNVAVFVRVLVLLALVIPRGTAAASSQVTQPVRNVPSVSLAQASLPVSHASAVEPVVGEQPVHGAPIASLMKTGPVAAPVLQAASPITATVRAISGTTEEFTGTLRIPSLILKQNGMLNPDPAARTLEITVRDIEVPPGVITITLEVATQHRDPDRGSRPGTEILVLSESQTITNTSSITQTGVTLPFTHEFTDTLSSGVDTPTDYFQYIVLANGVRQISAPYAFLMENQDDGQMGPLADGRRVRVSYCDMFPFEQPGVAGTRILRIISINRGNGVGLCWHITPALAFLSHACILSPTHLRRDADDHAALRPEP